MYPRGVKNPVSSLRRTFVTKPVWWTRLKHASLKHGRFFSYYNTSIWLITGALSIYGVEVFGSTTIDPLVKKNLSVVDVNPSFVKLVLGLAMNELLEPIRFPFTALTVQPMARLFLRFK